MNASQTTGAVRPTTREAWHALLAEGKTPSVRTVYAVCGGKYTRLVAECRILRQEGNTTGEVESGSTKFEKHRNSSFSTTHSKTYVCARWPFLRLGGIRFRDGTYTTDDEAVQAMIENSDSYGVHIHEAQG